MGGISRVAAWLSGYLPMLLAAGLTLVFARFTYLLAAQPVTVDGITLTRFEHFMSGSPNTMGDTLSGFVGSLTLIWVVASVLQQSQELRLQRRELQETRMESAKMAAALQSQAEIFLDEKRSRDEQRAGKLLDEKLLSLESFFQSYRWRSVIWEFSNTDGGDHFFPDLTIGLSPLRAKGQSYFAWLERHFSHLYSLPEELARFHGTTVASRFPAASEVFDECEKRAKDILSLRDNLSEADREKVGRLSLSLIPHALYRISSRTDLFRRSEEDAKVPSK